MPSPIPSRLDPEIAPRQADAFAGLVSTFRASLTGVLDAADAARVLARDGLADATVHSILKDATNYGMVIPIRKPGRTAVITAYRLNPFYDFFLSEMSK